MFGALLVLVTLAQTPTSASLAAPGLSSVNADPKVVTFFNEYFSQQLVLEGIRVTTPNEIQSLIGFERQKQMLGCAETSSSCLAELAGALGVDGIITGSVGKFGGVWAVNIKIVAARNGKPMAAYSERLRSDEEVLEWLTKTANDAAKRIVVATGTVLTPAVPPNVAEKRPQKASEGPRIGSTGLSAATSPSVLKQKAWIPAAVGGGFLVLGLLSNAGARSMHNKLFDRTQTYPSEAALDDFVSRGRTLDVLGISMITLGLGGLATAGIFYLLPGETAVSVGPTSHGGGALVLRGSLP